MEAHLKIRLHKAFLKYNCYFSKIFLFLGCEENCDDETEETDGGSEDFNDQDPK